MDFRQRLAESRIKTDADEATVEHESFTASRYFATDKAKNPACLELRLPEGVRKALPYSYITELNYGIDKGIEIFANSKRITITGRNLAQLFDYLVTYRVRYVQMQVGSNIEEDGLFVEAISIEEIN